MLTPSWHLPAARLEGVQSHRALTGLAVAMSGCLVAYAVTGGYWPLAAVGLIPLLLLLPRATPSVCGASPTSFQFDGLRWYRGDGRPARLVAACSSTLMLAAVLRVDDRRYRCLLWRGQCEGEAWRRLRLALRYGAGDSTVSPAAGPSSG